VITYQTRKTHIKANALIKRSGDQSKSEDDDRQRHQPQLILTANKLNSKVRDEINITEIIEQEEIKEKEAIFKENFESASKTISKKANILEKKLFVLENKRLQIIKKIHDQSAIEHFEIRRILKMMKRFFY
jgi:hypothetical protein